MITRRETLAMGVGLTAALTTGRAAAQDFPSRPINLIVMAPAGGSTDVGARVVAALAEKIAGQPIVVVNKGGAGGQVGWTELARSKPDGYTIGFVVLPGMNTQGLDPSRQAIFTEESFVPVANQVSDPGALWVKADSPFKTFADVIEAAKKAPGTVRAATTGILSDDHLAILMTEEATGAHFRIVHLDGNANQLKETLSGNVDVAFDNVGGAIKPVKAGQGRALAVTDPDRSKFLPEVPTTVELGFPTIISSSTRGITAPKGTPPEILRKLADMLGKAMAEPEHNAKLEAQGLTVKVMLGDDYAKFYKEAHEKAKKYVEWARTRPQK